MAELKTQPTDASVQKFLRGVKDKKRREECQKLVALMKNVTRSEPKMWGTSIVGFGSYHYIYASGREGDWPLTGFSPRKQNLTLYIMSGFERYPLLMKQLGKYKTGKSCLYVNTLDDVNLPVLRKLIAESVRSMKARRT